MAGVLEIGPGPGALTIPLVERTQVTAVEFDARWAEMIAEETSAAIIEDDALEVDWRALLADLPEPKGIVSNMPYNITGPLLGKVIECADVIDRAVLMMQREVADRITAKPGDRKRGALSVAIESRFRVTPVVNAPPGAFSPPPKVASQVLLLKPERRASDAAVELAHRGFCQPRKKLSGNLEGDKQQAQAWLEEQGLSTTIRPHELTLAQWQALAEALQ